MIHEVGNIELCELLETEPEAQCKVCLSYCDIGNVYCTCGHFLLKEVRRIRNREVHDGPPFRQRTKRSVKSVTMHVHARAGAAHLTLDVAHVTHARCVAILAKAASVFLREPPAHNGVRRAWLALGCVQGYRCTYQR